MAIEDVARILLVFFLKFLRKLQVVEHFAVIMFFTYKCIIDLPVAEYLWQRH
jgi:hypothetical protein